MSATTRETCQEIAGVLNSQFSGGFVVVGDFIETPNSLLFEAAKHLKEKMGYEYLSMISAVDYADHYELLYRLDSFKKKSTASLKVKCSKDNPTAPSVLGLWFGARYQEREIYDLFGILFTNHHDLKRIVLWDGFEGHPLRKDYKGKAYGAGN